MARDLFDGRVARYPKPLVGDFEDDSGGSFAMVPICFERSVVVRTTSAPPDGLGLVAARAGARAGRDARRALHRPRGPRLGGGAAAAGVGGPPGEPQLGAARKVAAGETVELARLRGAGTLRHLRLRVAPFDTATLRSLSLRVTVDGAREPQIDVPLLNLFGDGVEAKRIAATAFGMAPDRREGYFSLPIPYRRGAVVTLAARRPAEVSFNGWTGAAGAGARGRALRAPPHRGDRRGRATAPSSTRGGSGRLAAIVLDVLRGEPSTGVKGLEFFLEGDERVHVDGARSPMMYGTGHEEISNGGFYFGYGPFTRELGGAGPLGTGAGRRRDAEPVPGRSATRGRAGRARSASASSTAAATSRTRCVGATTWSYRRPATLRRTGAVRFDDGSPLTAYFEGDHDGNGTTSTHVRRRVAVPGAGAGRVAARG